MPLDHVDHLARRDVLAATDDHVVGPPDDAEPAGAVDRREVAGAIPTVGRDTRSVSARSRYPAHTSGPRINSSPCSSTVSSHGAMATRRIVGRRRLARSRPSAPRSSRMCASRRSRAARSPRRRTRRTRRRRRSTRAGATATRAGVNAVERIIATKNVGGPTMKVTRSCSMRSSAASGSQRRMSTLVNGTAPGSVTPLSRPLTWASGAGISTTSSSAEAVHRGHGARLVRERVARVQHALRCATRTAGEQQRGERAALALGLGAARDVERRRLGTHGAAGDVDQAVRADHERRLHARDGALDLGHGERRVQRRGHRAGSPTGASAPRSPRRSSRAARRPRRPAAHPLP